MTKEEVHAANYEIQTKLNHAIFGFRNKIDEAINEARKEATNDGK